MLCHASKLQNVAQRPTGWPTSLSFKACGTSPSTMRRASPSTMAVFPTPGSPMMTCQLPLCVAGELGKQSLRIKCCKVVQANVPMPMRFILSGAGVTALHPNTSTARKPDCSWTSVPGSGSPQTHRLTSNRAVSSASQIKSSSQQR